MKWALIGIPIILVAITLIFLDVSRASTHILNKFIDYSDNLTYSFNEQTTSTASNNRLNCLFHGAYSLFTQPTSMPSIEKIAVIWLHGLGGNATRAYNKLKFSNLVSDQIHFFLPTANKILTPWMNAGLTNSWFTLNKIQSENENAEAMRAAMGLIDFIRCVDRDKNYTEIIVGGSSQGGAVAWLAANIENAQLSNDTRLSYILLNTWLPINHLPAISFPKRDISLIHNSFDDIVTDSTVHESVKNSRELSEIRTLNNPDSLHKSNTEEHIQFVHSFIKNKLSHL